MGGVPCIAPMLLVSYPCCVKWDIDPDCAEAKGQLFILGSSASVREGKPRALYRLYDEGVEKHLDERKKSGQILLSTIRFGDHAAVANEVHGDAAGPKEQDKDKDAKETIEVASMRPAMRNWTSC